MSETNNLPKIWSRLEVKRKDGSTVKLRFEDMSDVYKDDVMQFHMEHAVRDEAVHKACGITGSKDALEEYTGMMKYIYENDPPNVVICWDDENDKIAGISVAELSDNTESLDEFIDKFKFKTKELLGFMSIVRILTEFEKDFELSYDGRGITVHPDYRGLGIANEFIRLRKLLCEANNIPVTRAWMTSVGSQRAAEKNNWKVAAEISPEEVSRLSGITCANDVKVYKLMYLTK